MFRQKLIHLDGVGKCTILLYCFLSQYLLYTYSSLLVEVLSHTNKLNKMRVDTGKFELLVTPELVEFYHRIRETRLTNHHFFRLTIEQAQELARLMCAAYSITILPNVISEPKAQRAKKCRGFCALHNETDSTIVISPRSHIKTVLHEIYHHIDWMSKGKYNSSDGMRYAHIFADLMYDEIRRGCGIKVKRQTPESVAAKFASFPNPLNAHSRLPVYEQHRRSYGAAAGAGESVPAPAPTRRSRVDRSCGVRMIADIIPENKRVIREARPMILTAIITSDYQVRGRRGWTGFRNEHWVKGDEWRELLFPNVRVDVNHTGGLTRTGFIVAMEDHITKDYLRIQSGFTEPRPMHYVMATMILDCDHCAAVTAHRAFETERCISFSIDHRGKKPYKRIGPCVTVCGEGFEPANKDCYAIVGRIGGVAHGNIYPDEKVLPDEIYAVALRQFSDVMEMLG